MGELRVVRLLQNPLGQVAPPGERGDMVRVSDDDTSVYLLPWEFEATSAAELRWLLGRQAVSVPRPRTPSAAAADRPVGGLVSRCGGRRAR